MKSIAVLSRAGAARRLFPVIVLIVLSGLLLPATALAEPPEPGYQGPEKCAECHSAETEAWQDSPHAQAMKDVDESVLLACNGGAGVAKCSCLACHTTDFNPVARTYEYAGVSCEACHGPYVEGHPRDGVMRMDVDSSICRDCHVTTYEQWQSSPHAQADVQCIGCHLSHSQDFRLTDEALCGACHRDQLKDFAHTAHESAQVGCTDCHLSSTPAHSTEALATEALASADLSVGPPTSLPSHSFSAVSSQACVNCHGQTIHKVPPRDPGTQATTLRLLAMADRAPELAAQLESAEQANKTLRVMTLVSLGLGMGIGGMMGIVFMLAVGYVLQGRAK
ncbi:MAG: hypothetical protein Kow0063_30260 [Anaerolineae bacterium]